MPRHPLLTLAKTLEVLALCLWLGGLVVAGAVVAPVTFGALERAEAGRVMGEVFRRLNTIGIVCGGILLFALAMEAASVQPSLTRSRVVRAASVAVALGLGLYMGFALFPEMETLRREMRAASSPPAEFQQLHELSRRLISTQMLLLLFSLVLSAAVFARAQMQAGGSTAVRAPDLTGGAERKAESLEAHA
jgi:hypothetical protein